MWLPFHGMGGLIGRERDAELQPSAARLINLRADFDRLSKENQQFVRLAFLSAVSVCLGILSIYYWIHFFGVLSIRKPQRINLALLLTIPVLTLAALAGSFIRWHFLLRVAAQRIPIRPSLSIFLAGLVGIATIAHVGELLSCVLLRRRFGVRLRVSVPVWVITLLYDITALSVIIVVTAESPWSILVGLILFFGSMVVAGTFWVIAPMLGFARKAGLAFIKFDAIVPALMLSLSSWVLAASAFWVAALAVGTSMPIVTSTRTFALSTVINSTSLIPPGIGTATTMATWGWHVLGLETTAAVAALTLTRLAATGTALLLGLVGLVSLWRDNHGRMSDPLTSPAHFDEIAAEYSDQWSPHMWDLLIERKLQMMQEALPPAEVAGVGLDLGCGMGLQTAAMRARGFDVVGIDPSEGLLRLGRARSNSAPLYVGSALDIPFPAARFDFVYMIGVIHHLPGPKAQRQALNEIYRVLRPGGILLIHESNTRNPLFRFYMSYVFPLIKSIDDGTEFFVEPQRWANCPGFTLRKMHYFTFLPDFMPRMMMKMGAWVERQLEQRRTRSYSAHYFAVMCRD